MPSDSPQDHLISVVVPVFGAADVLAELSERVLTTAHRLRRSAEIIFVDDGSPPPCWSMIQSLVARAPAVFRGLRLPKNMGQHTAVLVGLYEAQGGWCIVLDADLQDPPEAIPTLIEAAAEQHEVVFAGRQGRYQPLARTLTGRLYRRLLSTLVRVPSDAAMFFAIRRSGVRRVLDTKIATISVVAMIGLARLRQVSVPVRRGVQRQTTYTSGRRIKAALRMLLCVAEARLGLVRQPVRTRIEALRRSAEIAGQSGSGNDGT
jgi:polyisoprenyl-phosphate glycosyltransferase